MLSTIAFGWIALGSLSAAMGFLPLFAARRPTRSICRRDAPLSHAIRRCSSPSTTKIRPACGHYAAIDGRAGELKRDRLVRRVSCFRHPRREDGAAEEAAYRELETASDGHHSGLLSPPPREPGRKAGNIKDWVERFGGGYQNFIILDGDSVMSGETLVRLALAMERRSARRTDPDGPAASPAARRCCSGCTQFASNVYGPAVAAGLAFWHRDQGNYWGHNAIIRTVAFAGAAGLARTFPAKPRSAAISRVTISSRLCCCSARVGACTWCRPSHGSYEGLPPNLMDLVVRDRRWAQGNLQHLSIFGQGGITTMGRLHLAMGAMSYLVSAIWALSLAVGVVLALQSQQMIPSYFEDSKTLFPIWPVIDPGAALRLFIATIMVVMLPKALGLALEIKRVRRARERVRRSARIRRRVH